MLVNSPLSDTRNNKLTSSIYLPKTIVLGVLLANLAIVWRPHFVSVHVTHNVFCYLYLINHITYADDLYIVHV